uniref:Uncharacterized protein n=1 Tax=Oryza barthii TaxID=65489 RepID=A0A0D3HUX8_9ORYZ
MVAADADADGREEGCDLFECFCRWRKRCSPRIPRVSPARDYVCISSDASGDSTPKWSVLVGCTSIYEPFHNLRTHRFRVSGSGRVMGCSDDMLERFRGVSPLDDEHTVFSSATAAMAPDGHNLCIICAHSPSFDATRRSNIELLLPKAFLMDCADKSLTALPPLPLPLGSYAPVSAHGELWTPATVEERRPFGIERRLMVYLLEKDGARNSWAKISDIEFPFRCPSDNFSCGGPLLHGYAIIRDRFILMSFIDFSFFCFDCATCTLTQVTTEGETKEHVPINGRAAHVADNDNGIYFIDGVTLFRYNYSPEADEPLKPPKMIDTICPYRKEGYGFLVHLKDDMLCAVWMNMKIPCKCATRHVLITTFRVQCQLDKDGFEPKVLEVLHSTFRRIGMLRSKAPDFGSYDRLCFLQEYLDDSPDIDPWIASMMRGSSSHPQGDEVDPQLLFCCRQFLIGKSRAVTLEDCKVKTKSHLYFVCQVGQRSLLFQISNSGGKLTGCHEKVLQPQFCLETARPRDDAGLVDDPHSWHFVHQGSKLYFIPSNPCLNHYEIDLSSSLHNMLECKRPYTHFSMVSRAGQYIVALGDTLQDVYILDQQTLNWVPCKTLSRSLDLTREVKVSGFVDLIDDAFVLSDADTPECFMLDMKKREWFPVNHLEIYQYTSGGLLNGRCIYAEGFIYMCVKDGIFAFELVKEGALSYRLDTPTLLEFQWKRFSNSRLMSFDLISGDIGTSTVKVFCVVEGYTRAGHPYPFVYNDHELAVTTVQVKLEGSERGAMVPVGIRHVDIAISSIQQEGWILTSYSLAV